jgi:Transglutaminase-like superfamily
MALAESDVRVNATGRVLPDESVRRHAAFQVVWYVTNVLLLFSILVAASSVVWEYSTRRYLQGFSDAVVPASGTPEEKIEAILHWMSSGPARRELDPDPSVRDPVETLNYASLLRVCGSATNAFLNLADSSGLEARRLLLIDSDQMTKHVVAEVLVGGRWIVVDPAFRVILRDASGQPLTRIQLADPSVRATATRGIPGYSPDYTFNDTVHVRVARLGVVGRGLRRVLDHLLPGWEDSMVTSLLLERESLATLVIAILSIMLLVLIRISLRWYGSNRLGIHPSLIRARVLRACSALLSAGTTP